MAALVLDVVEVPGVGLGHGSDGHDVAHYEDGYSAFVGR